MSKKTVIIGASEKPERYAYRAAMALQNHNHEIILLGKRSGSINGINIIKDKPQLTDIDTVTLYINPSHQPDWYNYVIDLKPKRVIFNPGAENEEFAALLRQHNIEPVEACTLVMLSIGNY
jgi:uncharacterized protein